MGRLSYNPVRIEVDEVWTRIGNDPRTGSEYEGIMISDLVDIHVYAMTWMSISDNPKEMTKNFIQEKLEGKTVLLLTKTF